MIFLSASLVNLSVLHHLHHLIMKLPMGIISDCESSVSSLWDNNQLSHPNSYRIRILSLNWRK
jgi:hypothetical protein